MSSEKVAMKDGKVAVSDREKYRSMALDTGNALTVPPSLLKAFKEAGLVSKWVSKAKIAKHGGYHPSQWMPYEISPEQKKELPAVFLGNVVTNCLERGDLILAVKPIEMQDSHKRAIREKTDRQLNAYYQETDAKGRKILSNEED